eukprot:1564288-Heterocapsa_arctica.AAC.1
MPVGHGMPAQAQSGAMHGHEMGRSHCAREQCVVHSTLSDVGPRSAQKHYSAQLAVFHSGVTPRGPIFHFG